MTIYIYYYLHSNIPKYYLFVVIIIIIITQLLLISVLLLLITYNINMTLYIYLCLVIFLVTGTNIGEPEYAPQFSGAKPSLITKMGHLAMHSTFHSAILSDSTVLEQVEECLKCIHTDGLLQNFCDGTLHRNHPIFIKKRSSFLHIV